MIKKILILFFLCIILNCCVFAQDLDNIWKKVDENIFINSKTVIQNPDGKYSFILKAYNKGQYEPINGQYISYTISQYFLDCENLTYKIGVIDSFSEDGNFVNGDYNRYAKSRPIVSGTAVSNIANKICYPRKTP